MSGTGDEPVVGVTVADPPKARVRPVVILFLAGLVGVVAGALGAGFRLSLEWVGAEREALLRWAADSPIPVWLVAIVVSGIAVGIAAWLVARFAPEAAGSGVQEIEGALAGVRPIRFRPVVPIKFVGGILALGAGLVLGREGPTIQMGGNVGEAVGDRFRLTKNERHSLIAAGAAAGLAAAFNAPLAGILFIIEEMRRQFRFGFVSYASVFLAAGTSDIVVRIATGQAPVIQMEAFPTLPLSSLWLFPIFGAVLGLLGVAFNRSLLHAQDFFVKFGRRARIWTAVAIGGAIGLIGAHYPDAIGGGYLAIGDVLQLTSPTGFLIPLFLVRFVGTVVSYGAGVPGGIFAPMLALGTIIGLPVGFGAHFLLPELIAHPGVFAVAGMAGLFSASVRAPVTSIALITEMTGNFDQILPLLLTAVFSTTVAQAVGGRPIYSVLLQRTLDREAAAEKASAGDT